MSISSIMLAAACAAKCPPHAIAVAVGVFAVGFVAGRLTKRCKCGDKKPRHEGCCRDRRDRQPLPRKDSARQPVPSGSVEIYVGNLSYDLNDDSLKALFTEYGDVVSARIVTNRFNGKSKGFGFVVMSNRDEAEKAIAAYSEKEYMGRKMRVNEAKNTITE